jgi:hypothetical protein
MEGSPETLGFRPVGTEPAGQADTFRLLVRSRQT